jgi:CubicO group peptidase (beta-lactamase class C family)
MPWPEIDHWVDARRVRDGTPGLQLAITGREGLMHEAAFGFASLESGGAMRPDHLLETGSIGKSFTALALLQLADEGRVDLHAPVTDYLPWFSIRSAFPPVTLHHLLTHSAGITAGIDFAPVAGYQVWALRESETSTTPGAHFHYSNIGYKVAGMVLETVEGAAYAEIIQRRILDPLGLAASVPVITNAIRTRLATGYAPLHDDRTWWPGQPLAPAAWLETDTADGCLAQPARELAAYLRMLMNRGRGPAARLLSEERFAQISARAIPVDGGEEPLWYGYGLFHRRVRGHHYLGHPGGMVGYFGGMLADMDTGIGVAVLVNGPGAPNTIARAVVDALCDHVEGRAMRLPELDQMSDLQQFAGGYEPDRPEDPPIEVVADGESLTLQCAGETVALAPFEEDQFASAVERWSRFPFTFARDGEEIISVTHGPHVWHASGRPRPDSAPFPPEWAAYPGHYRAHNPWLTNFRVFRRSGRLWLAFNSAPDGLEPEQPLAPVGGGRFRAGDDSRIPEWIAVDTVVDGRARRARLSGGEFYRVTEA